MTPLTPAVLRSPVSLLGASSVHVLTAGVYSFTAWACLLAWAIIAGPPGAALLALVLGPVVISGVIAVLIAAWLAWCAVRYLWRGRATFF